MIAKLSDKIANSLIKSETISIEDKEIYTYGLEQGAYMFLNLATSIAIGLILKMLIPSIVFLFAYMPLRSYAGGAHAKTHMRCYFLSALLVFTALLAIKLIPWTSLICSAITAGAAIIIFMLAPVQDNNKPLDEMEIKVYKKRSRIILCMLIAAVILLMCFSLTHISGCIAIALGALSLILVVGKIKNNIIA